MSATAQLTRSTPLAWTPSLSIAVLAATALPRWDLISHTFVVTTNPDGSVAHTYSWGNTANSSGWNPDQSEDLLAAAGALTAGLAEYVGSSALDPFVQQAYGQLNTAGNSHPNYGVIRNCKIEAHHLLNVAGGLYADSF
jgi:hypothetical protein